MRRTTRLRERDHALGQQPRRHRADDHIEAERALAHTVAENVSGTVVVYGRLRTISRDVTGGVTYSLDSAGDASNFSIDANTGEVTLVTAFDYEAPKTSYSFTVIATDAGFEHLLEDGHSEPVTNADEDAPTFAPADASVAEASAIAGALVYTP